MKNDFLGGQKGSIPGGLFRHGLKFILRLLTGGVGLDMAHFFCNDRVHFRRNGSGTRSRSKLSI